MPEASWLSGASPAFRLILATSWLAPESWRGNQEEAIRAAIGAGLDWTEYVRLVDRHRIPALSWAALSRVPGILVPEPAKKQLQERSNACRMEAIKHCLLLAEVLKGFNRAGIPVMSMKGEIFSSELYGDPGLRQSRDLDLAVIRDDVGRAQACLESMGWRLDSTWFPLSPRQLECVMRREYHFGFVHSNANYILELHWRNPWDTPAQTSDIWARSVQSCWQGCLYRAMSPGDLVPYLCNHGSDHLWFRAKWLGDLARAHTAGQVDWEELLSEARRTGQQRVLLLGLRLLNLVFGLPLPNLPEKQFPGLPLLLIERPLRALKNPGEPDTRGALALLRDRVRMSRYQMLLRPRKTWWETLSQFSYNREDFKVLRLPDRLFLGYVPLRPFLWAWRWLRQSGNQTRKHVA
jgi:hypothetical protein